MWSTTFYPNQCIKNALCILKDSLRAPTDMSFPTGVFDWESDTFYETIAM